MGAPIQDSSGTPDQFTSRWPSNTVYDTIIVGAGLFGQIINKSLQKMGQTTLMMDSGFPNSGSAPAACLMKPSWFSSMGDNAKAGLEHLSNLYSSFQVLKFKTPLPAALSKEVDVYWVDPKQVLGGAFARGVALDWVVEDGRIALEWYPPDSPDKKSWMYCRKLVLCTGVWSVAWTDKVKLPKVESVSGASFTWNTPEPTENYIRPWAPYKQLVKFNIAPGQVWVGDGSAIKESNWSPERQRQSLERCAAFAGLPPGEAVPRFGRRPYVSKSAMDGKPCYFKEVAPNVYFATGGAKNGTIAAGWCGSAVQEVMKL